MAITDFLTSGSAIPTGSALTSVTNQTVLPDWYTNAAMQAISNQNAVAQRPYTPYQGPRVAGFTPGQQQGFGVTNNAATAYVPGLNAATQATQNAMAQPGAVATSQPYFDQAGQTSVQNIGQYMNPYTDQVVNRIADLGARNLRENIMPGIESKYISAGQLGFTPSGGQTTPSGMMTDTARAVRDVSNDVLGQQSAALQSGYNSATGLAGTDLARQAQIGNMAGQMRISDLGQQFAGADQLGNMAGLAQKYGLEGGAAMQGVGQQQQTLNQQNMDVAYGDFLRQQGYPQEQINAMLGTLKGVQGAVPSATQQQGIVPSGQQAQYAPSTASTIAGGLLGLAGILKG